ncbi:hypothetical protein FRX31_011343 [Thalictrum thalictroides]|uniref:Uncharacterized protein n=1 Tax=Thalictrum thalictroides TaxID=46969 RepID=A0A7J6WR33_THATH|nr:hypothetical protein FRX31_011343 [Thalictrum thalictroides]
MLGAFDRFKHTDTVVENYEKELSNDFKHFLDLCLDYDPSKGFTTGALLGHPIMRLENILDVKTITKRMKVAMEGGRNNVRREAPELNDEEKRQCKNMAEVHTCYNLSKFTYYIHFVMYPANDLLLIGNNCSFS